MSRDSESLIEILIFVLIAVAMAVGSGSDRWANPPWSANDSVAINVLLPEYSSKRLHALDAAEPSPHAPLASEAKEIDKVSDLIELNLKLFAKPTNKNKNTATRQSC